LFVRETLASVQAQTHDDFDVQISVDGGDEPTAAACADFLTDSRFRMVVQDKRLGWVGNTNACLDLASGDYATILPHDDIWRPEFLAELVRAAKGNPQAACVYPDIETLGLPALKILAAPSLCGDALTRSLAMLLGQFNAVAFRGLIRQQILGRGARVLANEA